jgi:hypothetical protein
MHPAGDSPLWECTAENRRTCDTVALRERYPSRQVDTERARQEAWPALLHSARIYDGVALFDKADVLLGPV